ncbi:phage tail protein I [Thalassomonas viridans]|uniref:Phage tail protein I n=1 Tax=Thalassomonas viridans TaxID=137584 RepID=A0AAE9Z286_9GAMM|nr:phage tail protein I [Thalassomonas viridans]WDE04684.1 phage tail protein I [Thalassomonas viridans]
MSDLDLSSGGTVNISSLPANASELEYQLEQVMNIGFSADNLPAVEITRLWQPESCPEPLLPWLAWANGVKNWDDSWPESTRRGVIANSFKVHSYQGTRYAIEKALEPLQLNSHIHEWFEVEPNAEPGTFAIAVDVSEQGITPVLIEQIHDSVSSNKRGSAHYSLSLNLTAKASPLLAMAQLGSSTVTVQPWYASELSSDATFTLASAVSTLNEIKILPAFEQA